MKNVYVFILITFIIPLHSYTQSRFYSVPIEVVNQYLEDSIHVVGRLDLDFPVSGKVFVQFDG